MLLTKTHPPSTSLKSANAPVHSLTQLPINPPIRTGRHSLWGHACNLLVSAVARAFFLRVCVCVCVCVKILLTGLGLDLPFAADVCVCVCVL